ncbi:phospholipase D-like domain-containing protein [Bacillus sp. FJAT-29814]|uniref:phospholipase D-like domain-containing protein n=1 Tax=Bacillus sp. FJAT-29814 TaxID=1729688 RepID=UPI0008329E0B|nr:phospholipase D-like domain-containing protein [Bacillus sp. FJAT-29814]
MMKQINVTDAVINLSKDSFGYQEVLDDFENTRTVNIVTFNISKNDSDLIEKLYEIDEKVSVNIITNIPSRFETYVIPKYKTWKTPAQRALENIEYYCDTLDSVNFDCDVTLYFNFENHSKIITTDNVAYIGSANFSDESQNNFEAGIIIKNKADVDRINNVLIPEIIRHSKRFSTSYYNVVHEFMKEMLRESANVAARLDEGLFTFAEVEYCRDEKIFDFFDGSVSRDLWEDFKKMWYSVEDFISEIIEEFKDEVDITPVVEYLKLLNERMDFIEAELSELAAYQPDISDYAQESHLYHTGEPEDLEIAFQIAQDRINEERADILRNITNQTNDIESALGDIPQIIEKINLELDKIEENLSQTIIYENERVINNTGERGKRI